MNITNKKCDQCNRSYFVINDKIRKELIEYFLSIGYSKRMTCPECTDELTNKEKIQVKSYPQPSPCFNR